MADLKRVVASTGITAIASSNMGIGPLTPPPTYYELFKAVTVQDINGNDVQVPQSMGTFNLDDLNRQLAEIQSRIDAITAIKS